MDGETSTTTTQQLQTPPQISSVNENAQSSSKKIPIKKIVLLLLVITIFATAAYAAYYFYNQMQIKNRDSQRKTDIQTISQALEKYRAKTQEAKYYPAAITQNTLVKNGFLDDIPQDPKTNSPYTYTSTPQNCDINCTGFTLAACLENKNDPEGVAPLNQCPTKSYVIIKSP